MAINAEIIIEGEIREQPVPRLLNYLYDQEETGRLVLVQEGVNKTIHIIHGVPANVESSMRDETLGRYLVKQGAITEEDYSKSVEMMMSEGIQQGAALVKLGLIAPKELYNAVKDQNLQKLLTAFGFQQGQFRFYSEVEFIEKIYRFEYSFQSILKQGVYQYFPEEVLNKELRRVEPGEMQPLPGFEDRLSLFELEEPERDFARLIDGRKNLVEMMSLEGAFPFARRLLYVFLLCGLIGPNRVLSAAIRALAGGGKEPEARVDEIIVFPDSPELAEELEPEVRVSVKESTDKILEFYIQLKGKSYFEILDAAEQANDEEIEAAYRNRLEEFSRERFSADMGSELEAKLEEINTDIIKAYEALRSEERRQGYISELKAQEEKPKPRGLLTAEKFLQEGIKFVRGRDYPNAQKMFEKAVELSPSEPEYYGYLGWTIFCNPELDPEEKKQKAKEKIAQAIKMNPNMDSSHVFMGKLLQEEGDEQGAIREFKLALKCNPNCREARRELQNRGIEE